MSPPTANPTQNPRKPFPAWRLPDGTMKAAESYLGRASSSCERWEWGCAGVVVAAVFVELIIAWMHPPYDSFLEHWGSACTDAAIALGIVGEVLFSRLDSKIQTELRRRSNDKLEASVRAAGEANKRASEADLKRTELEAKLQPRMVSRRQFDLIHTLHGKLAEISIIHEASAEPRWFANSLRDAFFIAGIRVGMYSLNPGNPTTGVFIYDPDTHGAKASDACEVLIDIFRGTQAPVAMLTGLPFGVSGAPTECPAIIIGERFPVLPPHIAKAMQMGDAAYADMKRRGLLSQRRLFSRSHNSNPSTAA